MLIGDKCATVDCTTRTDGTPYCDDCNGLTEPTCDYCRLTENCGDDGCTICPGNWNGNTGNHLSCERQERDDEYERAVRKVGR